MNFLKRAFVNSPVEKEYPRVGSNTEEVQDIETKINTIGNLFDIPDNRSIRSACCVYIGLCMLRNFSEAGEQDLGRQACKDILTKYTPGNNAIVSLNASYFGGDDRGVYPDHMNGISRAAGIYLPGTRARAKRCFVLVVLGSTFNLDEHSELLHLDDRWLTNFHF